MTYRLSAETTILELLEEQCVIHMMGGIILKGNIKENTIEFMSTAPMRLTRMEAVDALSKEGLERILKKVETYKQHLI